MALPDLAARLPLREAASFALIALALGAAQAGAGESAGPNHRVQGGALVSSGAPSLLSNAPTPAIGAVGGTIGQGLVTGLSVGPGGTGVFSGFWALAGGAAGVCGNGSLEAPEECDDGALADGDGCSASCEVEDETSFFGSAVGGSPIALDVDGVMIQIITTPGQTGAQVAAALAAEINANPTLQGLGVTAVSIGARLVSDGTLSNLAIGDPGIHSAAVIPGLGVPGLAGLLALLGASGLRELRRRGAGRKESTR